MLKVTVYFPDDLFRGRRDRITFLESACKIIAKHMSSTGYGDNSMQIQLDPERDIDLYMHSFFTEMSDGRSTSITGIEIVGPDWPQRMANINERLHNINIEIKALLEDLNGMDRIQHMAGLSAYPQYRYMDAVKSWFVPMPKGCFSIIR